MFIYFIFGREKIGSDSRAISVLYGTWLLPFPGETLRRRFRDEGLSAPLKVAVSIIGGYRQKLAALIMASATPAASGMPLAPCRAKRSHQHKHEEQGGGERAGLCAPPVTRARGVSASSDYQGEKRVWHTF
jgi:hypothetical protein